MNGVRYAPERVSVGRARAVSVLAATCVAVAAQAIVAASTLQVEPPDVLEGQRVAVRITGLAPGERVTLHLARVHDRALLDFLEANIGRGGS